MGGISAPGGPSRGGPPELEDLSVKMMHSQGCQLVLGWLGLQLGLWAGGPVLSCTSPWTAGLSNGMVTRFQALAS